MKIKMKTKIKTNKILLIVYFFISITTNANVDEDFSKGLEQFKNKNYAEAQIQFLEALKESPNNLALMLNLGLTYYQLNQKGLALGYLLKANKLDPSFQPVNNAIAVIKNQLKTNAISQKESDFEYFRKTILNQFSLNTILFLCALTLAFSGFLWIRYFSAKKKAIELEIDLPEFPAIGLTLVFGFLVFSFLGGAKVYEAYTPRAIILSENTEVKISPGLDQNLLFTLQEGSEVLVGKLQGDWVQVTYPGSYTGWVPKEKIFLIR